MRKNCGRLRTSCVRKKPRIPESVVSISNKPRCSQPILVLTREQGWQLTFPGNLVQMMGTRLLVEIMVAVAVCQMDIRLGEVRSNYEKVMDTLFSAAEEGVRLAVFPELSLTGYLFDEAGEIEALALPAEDPLLLAIDRHCRQLGLLAVVGFIERSGQLCFNTAGIFGLGPDLPRYRKVHLPAIGADRFLSRGDLGFPVYHVPLGRLGINICYDQRFPESARVLALQGAQLLVIPSSETMATHELSSLLIRARAYENRVYCIWANRVGLEKDSAFTGMSQIVDPMGETLCLASSDSEEIVQADLDPETADWKGIVIQSGQIEMDLFQDRAPEHYRLLTSLSPSHRDD